MLFGRLSACGLQRTASKIGISPKIRAITQFKPSKLNLYSVQKTHGVKWVITCPTKLGFPMRRRRTFTFGFSLEKWVWVGPATHDDVQEEFDSLFNKTLQLPGDVYLLADAHSIEKFACEKAAQRGKCLPPDFAGLPMSKYLQCLLPPGAMLRLSQYESARPQREGLAGHYMVDLDHNISFGPRSGPEMPALDTHPTIYSFQMERLVLAEEMLAAQGIDMFEDLAGSRGISPLKDIFSSFSESELRFFAGNSLHVPTYGAWLMYAMGNVVRRDDKLPRPLLCAADEEEEDD